MAIKPTTHYLGDGLYCEIDSYGLTLKANDPMHPTDTVYLEPAVLNSLLNLLKNQGGIAV